MTGKQRREQLITIGRRLFAEKGFEGTSVEEIAATAEVSKPVVYEHFGGKEGLYAVVVDREIRHLLDEITERWERTPRRGVAGAGGVGAAELHRDLDRRIPDPGAGLAVAQSTGTFASLISDVASQVEYILADEFKRRGLDSHTAPLYAQMLVGMVALTGQYWLDHRKPRQAEVASHLVIWPGTACPAWNGAPS
jgi:AcrR family transcriptional regulator